MSRFEPELKWSDLLTRQLPLVKREARMKSKYRWQAYPRVPDDSVQVWQRPCQYYDASKIRKIGKGILHTEIAQDDKRLPKITCKLQSTNQPDVGFVHQTDLWFAICSFPAAGWGVVPGVVFIISNRPQPPHRLMLWGHSHSRACVCHGVFG